MADYSVFTKPWQSYPIEKLIETVQEMGFNAIELPVRDEAQVSPASAEKMLPQVQKQLLAAGIRIDDVASSPEERVFAACADCGIPMIRVMFIPPYSENYLEQEAQYLREMETWIPLCEKYGVKVAIQLHQGRGATSSADLIRIAGHFDPKHIGVIWDAAHSGLANENTEQALDLLWSHLALVNFKNGRMQMYGRGPDGAAQFRSYMCAGPDGQTSWPRAVAHLKRKGYSGTWCMPAEYTGLTHDEEAAYAKRDLAWLKTLVEG